MLGPIGETFSELLAQTTRKSNHQVDMEMCAEVGGGGAGDIYPGIKHGDLPQEML